MQKRNNDEDGGNEKQKYCSNMQRIDYINVQVLRVVQLSVYEIDN